MSWSRQLPDWAREMVETRIKQDTIWCAPCGMAERGHVEPVMVYTVVFGDGSRAGSMAVCRDCYQRAMDDCIKIAAIEPVEQPAHIAFLRALLLGLP